MSVDIARQLSLPAELTRRYRPERILGEGGYAVVVRAIQSGLERPVALKVLHGSIGTDPIAHDRFTQEARLAARLSHPAIVPVLDHGIVDGIPYIALPLIEGRSLRAEIAKAPLAPRQAAAHALRIAEALQTIHAAGIVHRDLKPENVLITLTGDAMVTDFGISRLASTRIKTETGVILGTPGYWSPERSRGEAAEPACDVYALGIILWEMLAGFRPFQRKDPRSATSERTPLEEILEEMRSVPPTLRLIAPAAPLPLADLAARMLAARPEARPTPQQVIDAIVEIQSSGVLSGPRAALPAAPGGRAGALDAGAVPADASPAAPGAPAVRHRQRARGLPWPIWAMSLGLTGAVVILSAWLGTRRPPMPAAVPVEAAGPTPARRSHAADEPEEVVELRKLLHAQATRAAPLRRWSEDPDGADCILVLGCLDPDQTPSIRPEEGARIRAVNGRAMAGQVAGDQAREIPPLVGGVNWIRVQAPPDRRTVATVLARRPCPYDVQLRDQVPDDLGTFEELYRCLFLEPRSSDRVREARERMKRRIPERGHPLRRTAEAWISLVESLQSVDPAMAPDLASMVLDRGRVVWSAPETRRHARTFLDSIQEMIRQNPQRWDLWYGVGWVLRHTGPAEAGRTALLRSLVGWSRSYWAWMELGHWERALWSEELDRGRDPVVLEAHRRAAERFLGLAHRLMERRADPAFLSLRRSIAQQVELMRTRARAIQRER
jgi:serine/threonine-protein kinase